MCAAAEDVGLCATCTNRPGCCLHQPSDRPVLACEEFHSPPGQSAPVAKRRRPVEAAGGGPAERAAAFRGLCLDCENRSRCVNLKGEGGVWHCEEYR